MPRKSNIDVQITYGCHRLPDGLFGNPPEKSNRFLVQLNSASFSNGSSSSQYFDFDEKEDELQFARTDYDCYRILGLHANASIDDVKASFRELAIKYHPDSRNQELPG